jgi:hypothetical protein
MEALLEACGATMEQHLTACVQHSLAAYLYDNAKWLGERLVALSASEVRRQAW